MIDDERRRHLLNIYSSKLLHKVNLSKHSVPCYCNTHHCFSLRVYGSFMSLSLSVAAAPSNKSRRRVKLSCITHQNQNQNQKGFYCHKRKCRKWSKTELLVSQNPNTHDREESLCYWIGIGRVLKRPTVTDKPFHKSLSPLSTSKLNIYNWPEPGRPQVDPTSSRMCTVVHSLTKMQSNLLCQSWWRFSLYQYFAARMDNKEYNSVNKHLAQLWIATSILQTLNMARYI